MILAYDVTDRTTLLSWRLNNGRTRSKKVSGRKATEILLPEIRNIMETCGEGLSALGVIRGPGSFTGIRVGLATAMGLRTALNIPVLGFSKWELVALHLGSKDFELLLPGGRGQVIHVVYREGWPMGPAHLVDTRDLDTQPQRYRLGDLSDGAATSLDINMTDLCVAAIAGGVAERDHPLEALYIRPPDARKSRTLLERLLHPT